SENSLAIFRRHRNCARGRPRTERASAGSDRRGSRGTAGFSSPPGSPPAGPATGRASPRAPRNDPRPPGGTAFRSLVGAGRGEKGMRILLAVVLLAGSAQDRRPNVVVLLADDQGWGDLGVHGNSGVATPAIDSLARDGALFERFFVQPVCSPTRAEFFTGR